MPRTASHRNVRKLTPEERKRVEKARAEVEAEKDWILSQGRAWKAAHDAAIGQLAAFMICR